MSPLLLLFAVLLLALLAVAAILLWRSPGESISGTSVAKDSIDSAGLEPRVRLANAAGQVRVEGVKGFRSVEYEAARYAMGADPAAKQRASEVPVDISREDSKIVIETNGGRIRGPTIRSGYRQAASSRSNPRPETWRSRVSWAT
jgi:hypothetical protein